MIKLLILMVTFISQLSLAESDFSYRHAGEQLFVTGNSCSALLEEIKDIPNINSTPNCSCVDDKCEIDLANYLPARIKQLLVQKKTYSDEPQCFNAAMYAANLTDFVMDSQTGLREFRSSPLCKQVKQPSFGDIVVVLENERIGHAFTYLTPNLGFTRNGGTDYQVQPIENTLLVYGNYHGDQTDYDFLTQLQDECVNKTVEEGRALDCKMRVDFYRCEVPQELKTGIYSSINEELASIAKLNNEYALKGTEYDFEVAQNKIDELTEELILKLPKKIAQKYLQYSLNLEDKDGTGVYDTDVCSKAHQFYLSETSGESTAENQLYALRKIISEIDEVSPEFLLTYHNLLSAHGTVRPHSLPEKYHWNSYGDIDVYTSEDINKPNKKAYFELLKKNKEFGQKRRKELLSNGITAEQIEKDGDDNSKTLPHTDEYFDLLHLNSEYDKNQLQMLRDAGLVFKEGYEEGFSISE